MKREPTSQPIWRDSLGIIVTVLSATMLAFVLLQVSRLDRQAGSDRATIARERLAVAGGSSIVSAMRHVIALQPLRVFDGGASRTADASSRVDRELARIGNDISTGPLSVLVLGHPWSKVRREWSIARRAPPGVPSLEPLHKVTIQMQNVLYAMEDASNLTYDTSQAAQNLADIALTKAPLRISRRDAFNCWRPSRAGPASCRSNGGSSSRTLPVTLGASPI